MKKPKNKSGADLPLQIGGMNSEPSVPLMDRYSESSKIAKIFDLPRIRILKISDMKKFGPKIFLAYEKSRFFSSNIFRRRSVQFFHLKNNL